MQVNFITNNKKISNHANDRGDQWTKKQIKKSHGREQKSAMAKQIKYKAIQEIL